MKSLSTKRGLYRAAIFFALLFLTSPGYARVSYVPVEAEGRGAALNDAISDALVQAIGQVNGKSIASEKAQQSIRSLTSGPDGSTASFSKDQSSKIFEKTRLKYSLTGDSMECDVSCLQDKWTYRKIARMQECALNAGDTQRLP